LTGKNLCADDAKKRKPVPISDQVAKDEKGRRRFHGAFTGGFSAGYFNTVGSIEGWQPAAFKSSKSSRSSANERRPEDFMDDDVSCSSKENFSIRLE
jgi:G patch domain-containing protein 1